MGRLLQLLLMFGPQLMRAYQRYQRQQNQNERRYGNDRRGQQQPSDRRSYNPRQQQQAPPPPKPRVPDNSKYKKAGNAKYKEYDYQGAIKDYQEALVLNPRDTAAHFNLACCYSLLEDATKSFIHLDKAVEFGMQDFDKIKTHDGLAYLRVQKRFLKFEKNGFRLVK